jgi:hypothetical protein
MDQWTIMKYAIFKYLMNMTICKWSNEICNEGYAYANDRMKHAMKTWLWIWWYENDQMKYAMRV